MVYAKYTKKTKNNCCSVHIEEDCTHKNGPLPHPRLAMSVLHFTQVLNMDIPPLPRLLSVSLLRAIFSDLDHTGKSSKRSMLSINFFQSYRIFLRIFETLRKSTDNHHTHVSPWILNCTQVVHVQPCDSFLF